VFVVFKIISQAHSQLPNFRLQDRIFVYRINDGSKPTCYGGYCSMCTTMLWLNAWII